MWCGSARKQKSILWITGLKRFPVLRARFPFVFSSLREFGGTLLRHGDVVFLDVEDLALRLAPILNHKTHERDEDGRTMFSGKRLTQGWQQEAVRHLFDRGILYRCFAHFLWEKPGQPERRSTCSSSWAFCSLSERRATGRQKCELPVITIVVGSTPLRSTCADEGFWC